MRRSMRVSSQSTQIATPSFMVTASGCAPPMPPSPAVSVMVPASVSPNEGVAICVDCDETRIDRRIEHRYLDTKAVDIDDALRLAVEARDAGRPLSIGLLGNAA